MDSGVVMTDPKTEEQTFDERAARILARLLPELRAQSGPSVDPAAAARRYADGLDAFDAGRYAEAGEAFGDAAAMTPGLPHYHFSFGLCLQQCGFVREAAEQFGTALALDATDAAAAFRLGECFYAQGFHDDACEALRMAVRLCELPHNSGDVRVDAEALIDRIVRETR